MSYKVLNPYKQPKGSPVLTGVRHQELVDGKVSKDWYEGEVISDEALNKRQIETFVRQGVIKHMAPVESITDKIKSVIGRS